jgi:peptidoglycan/LPS O-acetylase OafA/YrhL
MSAHPLDLLWRLRPAPGTPAARSRPAPAGRRPAWPVAAAAVLAVLALGLALIRVDAMPRTRPDPAAAAAPSGAMTAGAAAARPRAAAAGQDPLATVPGDFAAVMGYAPAPVTMADGTVRLAKPSGACSVPGGGWPFGFERACKVHDYGYDLLRYADAGGRPLDGEVRRRIDARLVHDLHAHCDATRRGLAEVACHVVTEVVASGVAFNSSRQRYGNPAEESFPWWALGLAVPLLAVPLLRRLPRRRAGARGTAAARGTAPARGPTDPGGHAAGGRAAGGRAAPRGALARGLRAVADGTPAGRDRYADFLRVASIVTVVLGHWTITAVGRDGGGLTAGNVLSTTPWLWLATWVLQVMPVFFVVGGFANMVSWRSIQRRGGGYVEYLSGRMARLLRPVLAFAAAWLLLPPVIGRLGLPAEQVELVGDVMGQPLWFLGVYLVVVALAPGMVRLHRRFGLWVPATLALVAAAVDALRLAAGVEQAGYLNLLVVWTLVQQVGFFYADGTLGRLSRPALAGMGAAGLAGLVVLTGSGAYPPSMVGLPGDASNMSPPTVCIVALTVWQVALVMLARARVSAWLARPGPWTAVVAVGSMAMTIYLWHITAMVALYGLVVAADGPLPAPGTATWWATRPLWLALLAVALVPLALLLSRFERPGRAPRAARPDERPSGRLAVVLGLVLAALGLLGFVVTGFTPLLDPEGGLLLVLRVDPLQNLLHLLVGVHLARAAATGATARPLPWLLAAAGCALALAAPSADPLSVGLHATVAALALAVAALALAVAAANRRDPVAARHHLGWPRFQVRLPAASGTARASRRLGRRGQSPGPAVMAAGQRAWAVTSRAWTCARARLVRSVRVARSAWRRWARCCRPLARRWARWARRVITHTRAAGRLQ